MRDIKDITNFKWELLDLKRGFNLKFKLDEGELFNHYGLDTDGYELLNNYCFYTKYENYIINLSKTGIAVVNLNKTEDFYLIFENMVYLSVTDAIDLIGYISNTDAEEFIKFAEKNFIKIV